MTIHDPVAAIVGLSSVLFGIVEEVLRARGHTPRGRIKIRGWVFVVLGIVMSGVSFIPR